MTKHSAASTKIFLIRGMSLNLTLKMSVIKTPKLNIAALFDNPSYSDITVRLADASELHLHKCILAGISEYFAACFRMSPNTKLVDLSKEEYDPEDFKVILKWCYTGEVEFPKLPETVNIHTVDKLQASVPLVGNTSWYYYLSLQAHLLIVADFLHIPTFKQVFYQLMNHRFTTCTRKLFFFQDDEVLQRIMHEEKYTREDAILVLQELIGSSELFPQELTVLSKASLEFLFKLDQQSLGYYGKKYIVHNNVVPVIYNKWIQVHPTETIHFEADARYAFEDDCCWYNFRTRYPSPDPYSFSVSWLRPEVKLASLSLHGISVPGIPHEEVQISHLAPWSNIELTGEGWLRMIREPAKYFIDEKVVEQLNLSMAEYQANDGQRIEELRKQLPENSGGIGHLIFSPILEIGTNTLHRMLLEMKLEC